MATSEAAPPSDLEWIQLNKEMDSLDVGETAKNKLIRKVAANPFVPLGCLATAGALSYGLWSFRQGRMKMSQNMMRLRIVCQGVTIAALLAGVMITTGKK